MRSISLAALVLFTGCQSSDGPGEGPPSEGGTPVIQEDSAGISITTTRDAQAFSPMGDDWSVDFAPDLVLGDQDREEHVFFGVQGIGSLPEGGVVVVDRASAELRFFAADGTLKKRGGGTGEGPGEFRDPHIVPYPGSDSLFFFDRQLPRLQQFTEDGNFNSVLTIAGDWPRGARPVGKSGQSLLFEVREIVGGELALLGTGMRRLGSEFSWFNIETGEMIPVDSAVVDWYYRAERWEIAAPFTVFPTAAVTRDGAVVANSRGFELREFSHDGSILRIMRIDGPLLPVTSEMIARVLVDVPTQQDGAGVSRSEMLSQVTVPDSLPAFSSVLVDEEGWFWAEMYSSNSTLPKDWVLFDPTGVARGTVETPPGIQVLTIGSSRLFGVSRDELGVERVQIHAVKRSSH